MVVGIRLDAPVCQSQVVTSGGVKAEESGQLIYHRTPVDQETFEGFIDRMIAEKGLVDGQISQRSNGPRTQRAYTVQLSYYQKNGELSSVLFKLSDGSLNCAKDQAHAMDVAYSTGAIPNLSVPDEATLKAQLAQLRVTYQEMRTQETAMAVVGSVLFAGPAITFAALVELHGADRSTRNIAAVAGALGVTTAAGLLYVGLAMRPRSTPIAEAIGKLDATIGKYGSPAVAPTADGQGAEALYTISF